jgi:hypothetical protein
MGEGNDEGARLIDAPAIPSDGLAVVLASWSGRGTLFDALSVPFDQREARQWSSADVRLRTSRILLARLEPLLFRWPTRTAQWLDHLPATKTHLRVIRSSPFAGVDWVDTRLKFGWPANSFIGKEAERGADMLVAQVLRWCVDRLWQIWCDVGQAVHELGFGPVAQVLSAVSLLAHEPLASAGPIRPKRSDLIALRREGSPWGSVADVAHQLLDSENSLDHLVYEVLMPDEEMRWRLFHLAILGLVIKALKSSGCSIISLRPLSPKSLGPNYEVKVAGGALYSLWFEASNVWAHLDRFSPFVEATRGMRSAPRSNGADILLLEPDKKALIIECKYSSSQDFVARNGYYQAVAYAAEAHARFAKQVTSLAVGPESTVGSASFTRLDSGLVGTVPPSAIDALVNDFLNAIVQP